MNRRALRASPKVNPARAGMIPGLIRHHMDPWGKPRASGDDPEA